jgi:anti-sigma-K factor RskA
VLDRNQLTSDLLTDYALGFLSPEQAAEVEAALERHPEARAELNAYLRGLSEMVIDLGPSEVPAGAADRLLARLNTEVPQQVVPASPPPLMQPEPRTLGPASPESTSADSAAPARARRPWLYPLIGLAAAVAIGVAVLPVLNTRVPDFASYQAQPGAVTSELKSKGGTVLAKVVRLPDGHAYVQMQASLPAGRAYQAWKVEGGRPVSLGMFRGQSFIEQIPAGTVFAVSVEPTGGSQQPTTAPLFAQPI